MKNKKSIKKIVTLHRKIGLNFIKELELFKSYLGIKDERFNDVIIL